MQPSRTVGRWVARRWTHSLLLAPIRGIAFWLAVILPVAYGPGLLLYAGGEVSVVTLGGLVVVHGLALVVGHRYHPLDRREDASDASSGLSGGTAQW